MAQAEHLPIYKAGYELCVYLEDVVRRFSRYHKCGLGDCPVPSSVAALT